VERTLRGLKAMEALMAGSFAESVTMSNQQIDMLSGLLFGLGFGMIIGYYIL